MVDSENSEQKSAQSTPKSTSILDHFEMLEALASSYAVGVRRLLEASMMSTRIEYFLTAYFHAGAASSTATKTKDVSTGKVSMAITHATPGELDSFTYITSMSHLVYATTLFDTFLQGVTRLLFFLHPTAMGENTSLPIDLLVSARTKNEALTQVINNGVRNLGRDPFIDRIKLLKKRFGLALDIDDKTRKALEHYATARNTVVHDQGAFAFRFDDADRVVLEREKCMLHPTLVGYDEIMDAMVVHGRVVTSIVNAVIERILKCPKEPRSIKLVERLREIVGGLDEARKALGKNSAVGS